MGNFKVGKMARFGFCAASSFILGGWGLLFHFILSKIVGLLHLKHFNYLYFNYSLYHLSIGTTWMQEIVWQIYNEGAINSEKLLYRFPFLEDCACNSNKNIKLISKH